MEEDKTKTGRLERLLVFAKLLDEFRKIERVIRRVGKDQWENDSEHSFNLALLAWYILEVEKLPLNREKVLSYALAHDLVEVYAGDTYLYSPDQAFLDSKIQREQEAAERLEKDFPELESFHKAIQGYLNPEDAEAHFVYVLDKLEPVIQIYLDGGRTWKEKKITLQMLLDKKKDKPALAPELQPYFDELVSILEKQEKKLFG